MTSSFEAYSEEYSQVHSSVISKLDNDLKQQAGGTSINLSLTSLSTPTPYHFPCQTESRKATLRRITMELEEADEIVRSFESLERGPAPATDRLHRGTGTQLDQMEMEAKGKAKSMIVVRGKKMEVKKLRERVLKESLVSDREALLSLPAHAAYQIDVDDSDTLSPSASQRSRLLASTSTLKSSDARLDRSARLAAESEAIGGSVLESLRGQGAQLANARDTLDEADGSVERAQGTLKKMIRQ
ncbi:vesicle transport through interaction with t-SNAREs 1, partial [Phenoliferia sp. Uapishka_3]